jgi:hypothetical protein
MGAVNLDKMVEKNGDLLECERREIFGNVRGETKMELARVARVKK